jgi:prepilin-type N-terminal cleavage/methylation domain-containing protein
MKEKAFTLIELLAVIVILAIIALIATPIITSLIDKAEKDSELMSAKMYIDGVDKSILTYNISNKLKDATCEVESDGNLDCNGTKVEVNVQNTKAVSGKITIENRKVSKVENLKVKENYYSTGENGELVGSKSAKYKIITNLTNLTLTGSTFAESDKTTTLTLVPTNGYLLPESITVTGSSYTYDSETGVITLTNPTRDVEISAVGRLMCELVSGISQATGAEYTCTLDTDRTFYVLGDNEDSTKIDLIMNMNYTDDTVPATMKWCVSGDSNTCNHDNLDPLVSHVQEVFGNNVVVSLPSYDQIYIAAGNKEDPLPTWLYDYLIYTAHPVSNVYGYWTSSPSASNANKALDVFYFGILHSVDVSSASYNGFRPVITISKSLMN